LKKNNKKVEQTAKQEAEAGAAARLADLKNALEQVKKNGELPTDLEEKESFFMTQVALGESLCASEGKLNPPSHPTSKGSRYGYSSQLKKKK
jgi:import receptor subunit TOM20